MFLQKILGNILAPEADVIKGLVVDDKCLVSVLNQLEKTVMSMISTRVITHLVHREGGVVGLDNGVGDLGGRHH